MEAMAWQEVRTGDPWVSRQLAALTARIGAAQDEDGYLNTAFGHAGQAPRYSDMSAGARAVLHRLPAAGGRRAVPHRGAGPAGRDRAPCRRSRLPRVRARRDGRDLRSPGDRARPGRARTGARRAPLRRAGPAVPRAAGPGTPRPDPAARARLLPGRPAGPGGRGVARPRRAGPVPRRRGRRRRGGHRRRRAGGCRRAAVDPHGRTPHLPHRRHGLAPPGRGVRRGLGAARRPGVLRDLRRDRLDHGQLAALPGHRRRAVPRPDRAHVLQRRRDVAAARRPRVLLRQPAPAADAGDGGGRRAGQPPGGGRPARPVVRGVLLPDERRPHARGLAGLRGLRRGRRSCR